MNTVILLISNSYKELRQFLKSSSLSRAILVGIAVTLPIVLGIKFGYFEIGIAICFGAFWCSPSDISGNFRHKRNGILISSALVMVISFIGGYLHYETWLSLPVLGIISFGIAFFSIYGFRASLISFSGLLALVLSFSHDSKELEIYQYALLIGLGDLWYLFLMKTRHLINPKADAEEFLTATYLLMADFLETRAQLVGPHQDNRVLQSKLQNLQTDLTKNHETLRKILIQARTNTGLSNYEDKRLLIFVLLVEMLERAIANPVNYKKMDLLLEKHPEFVLSFPELVYEMADQLRMISTSTNKPEKLPENNLIVAHFDKVKSQISNFKTNNNSNDYEDFLMLQNLLEYQEKQFEKLKKIIWFLGNQDVGSHEFIPRDIAKCFLAPQDYDPMLLIRNLSFCSNIFRHSLRLAVVLMIGYTLGNLFHFQNPYWIY